MIELRPAVLTDAGAMAEIQNAIHRERESAGVVGYRFDVDGPPLV